MSDDMERKKNERLTAKQIEEEEEMKRELKVIGIYEPGSSYEEMKDLLGFLNVVPDNRNTQKENAQHSNNECLPDASQEQAVAQERTTKVLRSYSNKVNRTSPTVHERKTVRYSSSPESPSIFEVRNSGYRRKSSDSDEAASEKQQENRFISLRSGNVTRECQSATETRPAATQAHAPQGEHNQRLDRWRLNPLDICVNDNDVPLRQPSRSPVRERVPFGCCKEAHTSEQRDQVVRALSQHLRDMADLWYNWHRPSDSKFQWGSPIQVGTANGSLDRRPLTEPKTEPIKVECTYRDSYERASKRKASSLIASLNKKSSSEDEDDEYDFARVKKKKVQSESGRSGNVERAGQQHPRASKHERTTSGVVARQRRSSTNDDDNGNNLDEGEDNNKSLRYGKAAGDKENERLSPELLTYPRRIVPPNPKARLSLLKYRKGGNITSKQKMQCIAENEGVERAASQQKNDMLTDEEIRQELEMDNNEKKEKEEVAAAAAAAAAAGANAKKNVEIRPLSLSRELRSKLQEKRLLTIRSNDTEMTTRVTRTVSKEKEIDTRQRNKERKTEELKEERCGKEEKLYGVENRGVNWERQLMDDEPFETNRESNVRNGNRCDSIPTSSNIRCPICNKLFPHDEIEDHAAYCEQYETNNEEDDSRANEFVCNICSNYKTNDGGQYEKHVQQCIRNDKRHLQTLYTGSKDIAVTEQKDSETDHRDHSPSQSKTNKTGRKRKH